MDGGVRSGLDVVKALASGAKGCFIGRAWAWALAGAGQAGVEHVLQIMRQEMMMAMALTGCTDVRDAGTGAVGLILDCNLLLINLYAQSLSATII
jgi:L-lactate dehydrogenase (cytochrome)